MEWHHRTGRPFRQLIAASFDPRGVVSVVIAHASPNHRLEVRVGQVDAGAAFTLTPHSAGATFQRAASSG
jgi:hypothetical protein